MVWGSGLGARGLGKRGERRWVDLDGAGDLVTETRGREDRGRRRTETVAKLALLWRRGVRVRRKNMATVTSWCAGMCVTVSGTKTAFLVVWPWRGGRRLGESSEALWQKRRSGRIWEEQLISTKTQTCRSPSSALVLSRQTPPSPKDKQGETWDKEEETWLGKHQK